jgi:hypothetical protein
MNRIVIIGIFFFASGAAFVYYGRHRPDQANVEAVAEGNGPRFEGEDPSSARTELESSNRVRPIYAEVLSRIRGGLQAHIVESGDTRITIDLPALPENLYQDRYSGTVNFDDATLWTVEVFAPRAARLRSPPTLTIRFDDPLDLQEGPRLIFSLDTSDGEVAILETNGVVPSVGPLPAVIPDEDALATIAQLTQSIIEAQLLRLETAGGRP